MAHSFVAIPADADQLTMLHAMLVRVVVRQRQLRVLVQMLDMMDDDSTTVLALCFAVHALVVVSSQYFFPFYLPNIGQIKRICFPRQGTHLTQT
jgi:hypothetical protein